MRKQSRSPSNSHLHPPRNAAFANSSAYSESAQPDEDWTQIADLAERRRIQNRIAQRNYRKKLKLQAQGKKATSSGSVSPTIDHEDDHEEGERLSWSDGSALEESTTYNGVLTMSSPEFDAPHISPTLSPPVSTQYISIPRLASAPAYMDQYDPALTLSVSYPYSTYAVPEPVLSYAPSFTPNYSQSYPPNRAYMTSTTAVPSRADMSTPVLQPVLPADELLNPLSLNYAIMTGINVPTTSASSPPVPASRPAQRNPRAHRSARLSITLDKDYAPPSSGLNFDGTWTGDCYGQGILFDV